VSIDVDQPLPPLQMRRLPPSALARQADVPMPLGGLAYGRAAWPAWMAEVNADALGAAAPMADLWLTGRPVRRGGHDAATWYSDGHWMLGAIELDEPDAGGLEALARGAYLQLFDALRRAGCPHLLRVWNYLPRINEDGGGLERYRQFNLGRQRAFEDAGVGVAESAPAACALGTRRGGLSLHFLAGQRPVVTVENPRQVSAYRYPSTYGPRPPLFSRAALAELGGGRVALFVSGTASIIGHASVHPGDVAEQTREILRNLEAVLDAAHHRCTARFELAALDIVAYVRHPAQTDTVRRVLAQALGEASATLRQAVFLEADICRSDLLVEIEAYASAPGVLHG